MKEKVSFKQIEQTLKKQKLILEELIENKTDIEHDSLSINPNRADLARSYQENYRSKLLLARAKEQLEAVNQALKRIKNGTYGQCTACGNPIRKERLEVLPSVNLCIRCQQQESK